MFGYEPHTYIRQASNSLFTMLLFSEYTYQKVVPNAHSTTNIFKNKNIQKNMKDHICRLISKSKLSKLENIFRFSSTLTPKMLSLKICFPNDIYTCLKRNTDEILKNQVCKIVILLYYILNLLQTPQCHIDLTIKT